MPYIKRERREVIDGWLRLVQDHVEGDVAMTMEKLFPDMPKDCGELNYALTMIVVGHDRIQYGQLDRMLKAVGTAYLMGQPLRYQRINDVIGAYHGAEMELQRRRPGAKKFEAISLIACARSLYSTIGVAYEIQKIAENGDIDFGEAADAAAIRQQVKDVS